MNQSVAAFREKKYRNKIHPKEFAMWIACGSILMMFAGFTSAYVVRQAAGNWLEFVLPSVFYYSAGAMIVSSVLLQSSYSFFKNGKGSLYRITLTLAFLLGIAFVYLQYEGWMSMMEMGVYINGNPSGSFVYVLSIVHAAHVIGGIGVLLVALVHAFGLDYYVTPARLLRFRISLVYWHFVGFLWIYLLIFFTYS
ncbi:MAG: heme-copper oxidase subunit III [Saprospiraceae bacterium]